MCSLLCFLPALGWRMGPGGAVVFLLLCVSCLSVCEVAGKGRRCGKLLGVGGRSEENETPFQLWLKSEDERGAESPPPCSGACCPLLAGGSGAKGARPGEVNNSCRELRRPELGSHVSRARRRAEQVWGDVGCRALLLHQACGGAWRWLFAPGARLRVDLAAGAVGPAPTLPTSPSVPTLRWGPRAPGSCLGHRSFGGNFGRDLGWPLGCIPYFWVPDTWSLPGRVGISPFTPATGGLDTFTSEIWTGGELRLAASEGARRKVWDLGRDRRPGAPRLGVRSSPLTPNR